jgi:hypothetical protein
MNHKVPPRNNHKVPWLQYCNNPFSHLWKATKLQWHFFVHLPEWFFYNSQSGESGRELHLKCTSNPFSLLCKGTNTSMAFLVHFWGPSCYNHFTIWRIWAESYTWSAQAILSHFCARAQILQWHFLFIFEDHPVIVTSQSEESGRELHLKCTSNPFSLLYKGTNTSMTFFVHFPGPSCYSDFTIWRNWQYATPAVCKKSFLTIVQGKKSFNCSLVYLPEPFGYTSQSEELGRECQLQCAKKFPLTFLQENFNGILVYPP